MIQTQEKYAGPRTVQEAIKVLNTLGFNEVMTPAVVSAGKLTENKFKREIINALNNPHDNSQSLNFIKKCLCLSKQASMKFLNTHGIHFTHDLLVELGIAGGGKIISLMQSFNQTRDDHVLKTIKGIFDKSIDLNQLQLDFLEQKPNSSLQNKPQQVAQGTDNESPADERYQPVENLNGNSNEKRDYRSIHFYGREVALCFSSSQTRVGGFPTINIDAARVKPNTDRSFDWGKAIHFQFTPKELFGVLTVFMGSRKTVEFKSHGAQNDKGFSIEKQENKFFLKLFSKEGGARGVPISSEDAITLAIMFIDRISDMYPSYKKPDLLQLVAMIMKQ